jgi:predicted porin
LTLLAAFILFSALLQEQPARPAASPDKEIPTNPASPVTPVPALPKVIHIPLLTRPPKLEEFESMHPQHTEMAKISGFIQRDPIDGSLPTQQTDVYIGYDHQNLYVVWICFDKEPNKIRAHLSRRENVFDDDYVELTLDTFHDQRHALVFSTNALGIQADGLWTDAAESNDTSWDTVWNTAGKLTPQGYVVLQSIPFRSMRFHTGEIAPAWGVTFMRQIPRADEDDWWPRVSSKISGRLTQEATIVGIEGVSPGRNMQFNPYTFARTFRSVNQDVATNPVFQSKTFDGKAGLDSKIIFKDSLVLDTTIEPDFSQIESDQPQNTVNQRFEVFFPEKRPFFLENSNFFETLGPFQNDRLLFTRRIADPQFGARLTGKQGPWAMGFLVADDRSPGEAVLPGDPFFDKRALFSVGRIAYDLRENSSIGLIFTDREFNGDFNHVGGLDTTIKIAKNWTFGFRGVVSSTLDHTNTTPYLYGSDNDGYLFGEGQHFTFNADYQDVTAGFRAEAGFIRRTDIRHPNGYYHYYWRPKKGHMILHGPEFSAEKTWDHSGTGIQYNANTDYVFGFHRNTIIAPVIGIESDTLRPVDFTGLTFNKKFTQDFVGLVFRSSPLRQLITSLRIFRQGAVNVVVPSGQLPNEGDETTINAVLTLKPFNGLQIDNTYILDRVRHNPIDHAVFNNHILRTESNYQFTPALSLRFIMQYNDLLANQQFSSLQTTKNVNFDFLITYLVHPGTAIYAGYNTNLENIDPGLCAKVAGTTECDPNGIGLLHVPGRLLNDGRQVFIKISYLWRP